MDCSTVREALAESCSQSKGLVLSKTDSMVKQLQELMVVQAATRPVTSPIRAALAVLEALFQFLKAALAACRQEPAAADL